MVDRPSLRFVSKFRSSSAQTGLRALVVSACAGAVCLVLFLSASAARGGDEPRTWIVKEGHSVTGIAAETGVSWEAIAAANGLRSPYVIVPGQRLTIPAGGSASGATGSASTVEPGGVWIVKEEQSVTGIAARVGTSWKKIVALNGLKPPYLIVPGQRLAIPKGVTFHQPRTGPGKGAGNGPATASAKAEPKPSGGAGYRVEPGDTLERIGRRLGVPWRAIADANGIAGPAYVVVIGQTLRIPSSSEAGTGGTGGGGADESASVPATSGDAQPADAAGTYRVREGDTLERVGRRFGVAWRAIAKANGVRGPTFVIRKGQALQIPKAGAAPAAAAPSSTPGTYVVRPGDTLERIARRYKTSVLALVTANGLKDANVIRLGSKLRIVGAPPGSAPPPAQTTGRSSAGASGGGPVERSLERWAAHYDLPRDLVKGLAWVESGWKPDAVSSAGAVGVMQLMPATAEWLSRHVVNAPIDRYNADQNIRGGTAYLRWLLRQTGSNEKLAIGSYYQGLGATQRHGLYNESEGYVSKVQGARRRFG